MDQDPYDEGMRELASGWRVPPEPPLERMWAHIETEHFDARANVRRGWVRSALALAAALALGVALGRWALPVRTGAPPATVAERIDAARADSAAADAPEAASAADAPYDVATTRYLGQTAALLIALPAEAGRDRPDDRFVAQARELLTTTRLLLDSRAAAKPELRVLLEDLELVLAQIARLRDAGERAELDLITGTLEQRDVLPRLRSVAMEVAPNAED